MKTTIETLIELLNKVPEEDYEMVSGMLEALIPQN